MFSAAYHQFVLFPERSLFILAGHIYNIIPVRWEFSVPEGGSSVGSSVGGTKYAVKMYYTLDCATILKKLVSVSENMWTLTHTPYDKKLSGVWMLSTAQT